ncbi:hypothetical protein E4T39_00577 [Aureobasidium subglaciale]|nr:hypothetical protein E4T39_00577 [Aureobasidium subglaciale]
MDHSSSKWVRFARDDDPAATRAPSHCIIRGYRDHDFDHHRREPLDYDEFEIRSPQTNRHKRYNSEDGNHLLVHGSGPNRRSERKIDAPYAREELLEGLETLDQAHKDRDPGIQRLPQNRKRTADRYERRQPSAKKLRTVKESRSDRLCLDCGNYHSSPCFVPICSRCDTNHHRNIPCLDAMERLRGRLMRYAPPEYSHSSGQKFSNMISPSPAMHTRDKEHMPSSPLSTGIQKVDDSSESFSTLRTPTPLLEPASQSSINKQKRKSSPTNRACPLCLAVARLKRRLEEEDAKQSQTIVDEEIKQREQHMIDINNQLASSTLSLRRSSAPSPGHESGPDITPKHIRLKKNTRFCRDCGRYLNKPCTWPTCKKCKQKHFHHVPCWRALHELQSRLDAFDRGHGTSHQKKVVTPRHITDNNHVTPAAPVHMKAIPNVTFNFDQNGTMSRPFNLNKSFYYGPPPSDASAYPFALSAQEQQDRQQYNAPARTTLHALRSDSMKTADSVTQPPTKPAPREGAILPASAPVTSSGVAIPGLLIAQSVEALIAETAEAMHGSNVDASAPVDDTQNPPSYLEYLRRNGAE